MTAPIATDTSIATFSKTILKDNIADHHIAAGDLEDTRRLASGNRYRIPTINYDVLVDHKGSHCRIQRDCLTINPIRKDKSFNVILAHQTEGFPKSQITRFGRAIIFIT